MGKHIKTFRLNSFKPSTPTNAALHLCNTCTSHDLSLVPIQHRSLAESNPEHMAASLCGVQDATCVMGSGVNTSFRLSFLEEKKETGAL